MSIFKKTPEQIAEKQKKMELFREKEAQRKADFAKKQADWKAENEKRKADIKAAGSVAKYNETQRLPLAEKKYAKAKKKFEEKGDGLLGINKKSLTSAEQAMKIEKIFYDSLRFEKWLRFSDKYRMINTGKSSIIKYDDIYSAEFREISHYEETTTTNTKKKHGITRAIVGGAVAGGVGAVVGAASGGSRSSSNTSGKTVIDGWQVRAFGENGSQIFTRMFKSKFLDKSVEDTARQVFTKLEKIANENIAKNQKSDA